MQISTMMKRVLICSAAPVAVAAVPGLAVAQNASASSAISDNEIIVTAQKREERLQDVPLAVSAVTGDQIAARGFANIAQLSQLAPNVNLNEGIVNPTSLVPFIRGIGLVDNTPETDPPIAVSIDGVYLSSAYGGLVDAFDIQQVEILRGPQGTLQGRNAPGGAVNIITRRPGDEWVGRAMVEYGRFDDFRMNVGVDGPLIEGVLGLKLAGMRRKSDGYQKNVTTGERFGGRDTWALKGGLEITPTEKLNIWLGGDYTKDKSPPAAFRPANDGKNYPRPETGDQTNTLACSMFGDCTPYPKYTTGQTIFGDNNVTNWGLVANASYDAEAVTLTSVTGYRKIKDSYSLDIDATPFPLLEAHPTIVDAKTFSQEFRIASNQGGSLSFNDHVQWMIGGYHMNYKFTRVTDLFVFNNDIGTDYGQKLKSYAIFGNINVTPVENLELSVGARQNWDKKDFTHFTFGFEDKASWKKFVFDAGARYKFSPDHMGYLRFARGFRPGGFNQNTFTYAPETVDSWEAGLKTQWLDRRLTLNLAGFYYTYKGLQRQTDLYDPATTAFIRVTSNVGKAHAYGLELEMNAQPVDGLNLNFALGYLDAKYDKWLDFEGIDASGNPIPVDNSGLPVYHAPKWTVSAGVSYEIPVQTSIVGSITPAVNVYHKSAHFTQAQAIPVSYENGYTLLNASLKLKDPSGRFALTVFGDNLLDQYHQNSGGALGGLGNYLHDAPPRTYGVRFEMEFR